MGEDECEKTLYRTPKIARRQARILRSRVGEPMRAYHCPRCRRWHLTSSEASKPLPFNGKHQRRERRRRQEVRQGGGLRSKHRASRLEEAQTLARQLRARRCTEEDDQGRALQLQ